MVRSAWVFLAFLTAMPLFAANWQEMKADALARLPVLRAARQAGKVLVVDCTKGESVQAAIDKNASPVEVEIHGVCIEAVRIDGKDVTLRGISPATDGLQSPTSALPAVLIVDTRASRLENLSLSNNPATALAMGRAVATMENCVINGNGTSLTRPAVNVTDDSFLQATSITASGNLRRVLAANTGASIFCIDCDFSGNSGYVGTASRGGTVVLLSSTVTGRFGLQVNGSGSYADIDCISEPSAHPCSMQASRIALSVFSGGTAALFHAGDFTGRVEAHQNGMAHIYGARQLAVTAPGEGTPENFVTSFSTLHVSTSFEDASPENSRVMTTQVNTFGRMLITETSTLNGAINCTAKGDAWLDPTVTLAPGSSVTGCN